jgi:hypothetical protein
MWRLRLAMGEMWLLRFSRLLKVRDLLCRDILSEG